MRNSALEMALLHPIWIWLSTEYSAHFRAILWPTGGFWTSLVMNIKLKTAFNAQWLGDFETFYQHKFNWSVLTIVLKKFKLDLT